MVDIHPVMPLSEVLIPPRDLGFSGKDESRFSTEPRSNLETQHVNYTQTDGLGLKEFVPPIDLTKSTQAFQELANHGLMPHPSPTYPIIGAAGKVPQITNIQLPRVPLRESVLGSVSIPQSTKPPVMQPRREVEHPISYSSPVRGYLSQQEKYHPPEYQQPRLWIPPIPVNPEATDPIQDEKTRADYRVKFSILREAYPKMNIPEPTSEQSIPQIMEAYKSYVKRIHIDSSVEQNSTYLVILWLLIEVAGTRFFKFPMKGYFKNQFKYMNKYQMLLIELGERNYSSFGEGWPVEARILLMALFNGVIFVMVKSLTDQMSLDPSYTEEITEMINDYLTKGGTQKQETLRMAEEATSDNPPVPQPEPAEPLGGLGGLLGNLLGMFGGPDGEDSKSKPAPKKKTPTTFGTRTRKKNEDVPAPDNPGKT